MKVKKGLNVVEVAVFDYKSKLLPNARVTLRPLMKRPGKVVDLKFDKRLRVYRAADVGPDRYVLRAEAKGLEPDHREVQVDPTGMKETFILGKKGMLFYYRGKVKVPFEPPTDLLAASVKPDLSTKQEEELLAYARELKLKPERVGELIRSDNVRVFRFPPRTREQDRQKIQQRLSEHRLVRLAGPVIRLDEKSVSFLTNELIVKFKAHITKEEALAISERYKLDVIRTIPYAASTFQLRTSAKPSYSLLKTCADIVKSGLVEYAEPNLITTAVDDFTPNDFLFGQQPHHPIIDTEDAWNITLGDQNIIIAVVDAGCDIDHPDLTNPTTAGWNKIYSPFDFTGMDTDPIGDTHGTKSSGIAAAVANNSEGVAGVAPGCRLMPIKRPSPGTDTNYSDMYIWTAGHDPNSNTTNFPTSIPSPGADIISNSFGIWQAAISGIMKDTLDFLATYGRNGKGCVVVFSVGNDDADFTTYRQWVTYEKTIAVASSAISPPDASEVKVSTSNYGSKVDICAPGGGPGGPEARTLSTANVGSGDTSGSPGATSLDYDDFGQTSCACPQVAGVAALMLSVNPNLTWVQVRQILRGTGVKIDANQADPIGRWVDINGKVSTDLGYLGPHFSQWYGYGRLSALAAVQEAQDLVGVSPLIHIDTWIKENSNDIGDVPSLPPYSPDVWVRNVDPAIDNPAQVNIHQSPIRGQDNWVYANVRNRGAIDSHDVYTRIYITRWAGTQYIYPDDFIPTVPPSTDPISPMGPGTYLIGEVHIPSIPAGGVVTINTKWRAALIPPATVVVDGVTYSWADSCLLVEVSPHDGPTPTGNNTWDNNNLCQRNITILDASNDDLAIAFVIGHHTNNANLLNIRIDRKHLPAKVKLFVDYIDKGVTREVTRLLEKLKETPVMLDTCDLTVLTEAKSTIYCSRSRETYPLTIAPNTRLTLPCCPLLVKLADYRLDRVLKDNRTVFAIPTAQRTCVPVLRKKGEYQVVALHAKGLKKLTKGEYQIDVYQEDIDRKIEGGLNLIIHKR